MPILGPNGQRTYEATGPILSSSYLCELKELSLPSTEVAMDLWEAGIWGSPSRPGGTSSAGDVLSEGMLPLGCCFRCRGPLVLTGPLDLWGMGSEVASSLAHAAALEALEVLVLWVWLQGACRGTCEDWVSSSQSDSSVW